MRIYFILFFLFTYVFAVSAFDPVPDKSLNGKIENISRFSTGGRIINPPVYDESGRLFIFSADSRFYLFENKKAVKTVKLTSSPMFPVAEGMDNTLYGCFKDRSLRSYNRGGKLLWLEKLDAYPVFAPIVNSSGNIIIFLSDNTVSSYALNGRLRWKRESSISPRIKPVSFKNGIIFNDNSETVLLTDRGTIRPLIHAEGLSYYSESGRLFSVQKNKLIADSNSLPAEYDIGLEITKDSGKDILFSLLDSDMTPLWQNSLSGYPEDISIYDNNMYVLTDNSYFYRLNLSGKIIAEKRVDSSGINSFLVLDKYIYLLESSGYLKLYSRNFDFIDRILLPAEALTGMDGYNGTPEFFPQPCFAGENSMVVGGLDWIIYFFDISDKDSGKENIRELPDDNSCYILTDRLHYISELADSERYENRLKSLTLLEEVIDEGGLSRYEYEILDILFRLGTEGTINLHRNNLSKEGGADIRSRAAELIYTVGTEKSYSLIRKMISAENDEYVMIKCISLLGKAGSDRELKTLKLYRKVLEETAYNIRICNSVVSASENIAAYHGYLPEQYSRFLIGLMDIHRDIRLKNKIIKLLVNRGN